MNILNPGQISLLNKLVEIAKNIPQGNPDEFCCQNDGVVCPDGERIGANPFDVVILSRQGFISLINLSENLNKFKVLKGYDDPKK